MDHSLPKEQRLHSFGAIRKLFQEGQSGYVYPFRYTFYIEESQHSNVAVLFSTPKKFHKRANRRNTLRRRTKEAFRLNKELLTAALGSRSINIAIVYSSKTIHDYKSIENGVKRVLQNIAQSL